MSGGTLNVSTTPPLAGATLVGDINAAFASLATLNASASTPTLAATGLSSLAGYVWHDTTTNTLKVRDQADSAWIVIGYFDETAKTWTPHINPAAVYAADTGSTNAYLVAPIPAWATYATGGPILAFVASAANTGAATLYVSGLGVKNVVRRDGSALVAGDIPGTQISVVVWNAAAGNFTLLTQRPPAVAFVKGLFSKLKLTSAGSVQTATITADSGVLLDANGNPYLATAISLTPSLATSGAGGLDTGSVAPSTWYAVHLIYNGTTLQAVFSLSETAPTMPGGYTFKGRVGWVRTDISSNIVAYIQQGRRFQYINTGSGLPRMATGSTSSAWAAVALAAYAPSSVESMRLIGNTNTGTIGLAPNSSYATGISATNAAPLRQYGGITITTPVEIVPESSNVYWLGSAVGDGMFILGFEDNL